MQRGTQAKTTRWVEDLRVCCEMVRRTPPQVISAVSLTVCLEETPTVALSALRLSERIGEEYGLRAAAHLEGPVLTIRLSRCDRRDPRGDDR